MKKLILGLAFAGSLLVNAQEKTKSSSPVTFGVKAGFNATTLSHPDWQDESVQYDGNQKIKPGFNAGVFVNIPVAEKFSIQPELLFSQMGSKSKDTYTYSDGFYGFKTELDDKFTLNYIVLPLMVQYNILPQLYVEAGPEFGLLLGAKSKGETTTTEISGSKSVTTTKSYSNKPPMELYNKFNFGIGIGAGYYFTQNLAATARFTAGITDIRNNNSGGAVRNNAFQVGLAYKFK